MGWPLLHSVAYDERWSRPERREATLNNAAHRDQRSATYFAADHRTLNDA
jgi:hypothetical protein